MRRSKHYRPDVIMARVIFGVLCVAIIGIVIFVATWLLKPSDHNTGKKDSQSQQIENSQNIGDSENSEDTQLENDSQPEVVYYVRTKTEVRFRTEPNTSCTTIKKLPAGTMTKLIEELEGWYHVEYEGQEGYLSADYSEVVEGTANDGDSQSSANNYLIMIDPGHQLEGDSTLEPNGPNSTEMKARVTSGTTGVATGVDEYILNLEISLMLRDELERRGYNVIMTREVHEVDISNMERAIMANEAGADITVRVHANSYNDSSVHGAETMAPSSSNPYVSDIASESQKLSQSIVNAYCQATGMYNRGVQIVDNMTGINWCKMPVTIIELGFMSNPTDDTNMQDDSYQKKMVQGIADGIDAYFGL